MSDCKKCSELEAQAAQMREALEEFPLYHEHWDRTMQRGLGCEMCIRQREYRRKALSPDAGKALAERVRRLEKVAEAATEWCQEYFGPGNDIVGPAKRTKAALATSRYATSA